ncbi:MAG: Gfo/Idh/MocA family oxidoreductase [Defluviitaleaceae bacterium]|nr:Gfo/Idh/MocA family oxidoreductase [Defluviitaleaceae bacterium]
MRVAVVGLGAMGSTHYNLLRKMDDVRIIALVDIDPVRTEKKAAECGANQYQDLNKMLAKEEPDFVFICTPSYLHSEQALMIMKHGIHVLTEKPAALNKDDLQSLLQSAKDNNVMFMTAQVLRFWPEYVWLKTVTKSNIYGKLLHLNMWRIGQKPISSWQDWMLDKEKSGLVPFDLHIHDIDFMVYLLGIPEEDDFYQDCFEINSAPGQIVETTCQYKNGARVLAKAAWYNSQVPFQMGYEAIFEEGYAEYRQGSLVFYPNNGGKITPIDESFLAGSEINVTNASGYHNEIRYFIDCIRNNQPPSIVNGEELLAVLSMLT